MSKRRDIALTFGDTIGGSKYEIWDSEIPEDLLVDGGIYAVNGVGFNPLNDGSGEPYLVMWSATAEGFVDIGSGSSNAGSDGAKWLSPIGEETEIGMAEMYEIRNYSPLMFNEGSPAGLYRFNGDGWRSIFDGVKLLTPMSSFYDLYAIEIGQIANFAENMIYEGSPSGLYRYNGGENWSYTLDGASNYSSEGEPLVGGLMSQNVDPIIWTTIKGFYLIHNNVANTKNSNAIFSGIIAISGIGLANTTIHLRIVGNEVEVTNLVATAIGYAEDTPAIVEYHPMRLEDLTELTIPVREMLDDNVKMVYTVNMNADLRPIDCSQVRLQIRLETPTTVTVDLYNSKLDLVRTPVVYD